MDVKIGESSHWFILYPTNIRPLSPIGAAEAVTHFQLVPKEHYGSTLELDEEAARDLQSLKKTLVRFWKESDASEEKTRVVFTETSFESDSARGVHMIIDAVSIPENNDEDADFDLELVFQKALLEGDSQWKQSTAKKVIDTKTKRGDLQKCLPAKGRFSFVHVDFDGQGGMAHIIEDTLKFGKNRMLEILAAGPLGNIVVNLKQPLKSAESHKLAQKLKQKFSAFLEKERC